MIKKMNEKYYENDLMSFREGGIRRNEEKIIEKDTMPIFIKTSL